MATLSGGLEGGRQPHHRRLEYERQVDACCPAGELAAGSRPPDEGRPQPWLTAGQVLQPRCRWHTEAREDRICSVAGTLTGSAAHARGGAAAMVTDIRTVSSAAPRSRRAGHSVEVLMHVYARCVAGLEDVWTARMGASLR